MEADLQSLQFVFLLLEPHLSMVAACLPYYGPLLDGGRAPESIVRSVRSILSLASRSSSNNSKSRPAVRLPSNNDSRRDIILGGTASKWPHNDSRNQAHVSVGENGRRGASSSDDIELTDFESGINVTRDVDVVRE